MARPRGHIEWTPTKESVKEILQQMQQILIDNEDYLPISLRQMFYLGVSAYGWPKTESFYKNRLGEYLNKGRRAGMFSFDAIRDDGITEERETVWVSEKHFTNNIGYWIEDFMLDPLRDQDHDVIVWTEGKGLVQNVRRTADRYFIPVVSSGGFDGLTLKKTIADKYNRGRHVKLIHMGDFDPSGETMYRALVEDLTAFGADVEMIRLAVTEVQIHNLNLPTKPAKKTGNSHAANWDDSKGTVELEAVPPVELDRILTAGIESVLDMDIFRDTVECSESIRENLKFKLGL